MKLPNAQQVKLYVGYVATAAGTAITLLGLQAKGYDPEQIKAAIVSMGDTINSIIVAAGAVAAVIAAISGGNSASTTNVVNSAVQQIKADPLGVMQQLTPETKAGVSQAAVAAAANSQTANYALLESVQTLNNVKGVITDEKTAVETASPNITSDPTSLS